MNPSYIDQLVIGVFILATFFLGIIAICYGIYVIYKLYKDSPLSFSHNLVYIDRFLKKLFLILETNV